MAFLHCTACKMTWSPYDFICFDDKRPPCPQCRISTLEARIAELEADARRVHSVRYDEALTAMRSRAIEAAAERDEAVADARILAHAYEHDTRPPQDVVKRSLARLAAAPEKEMIP